MCVLGVCVLGVYVCIRGVLGVCMCARVCVCTSMCMRACRTSGMAEEPSNFAARHMVCTCKEESFALSDSHLTTH